jgi:Pvc16 N-terminal domain
VTATVNVPVDTTLGDLDDTLRQLLDRELGTHGFDGVQIVFDAPTSQWAAALTVPTVNLFLYDLRESDNRTGDWEERRGNGQTQLHRPALRLECSYAVTAWTRAVEDEHRLLSQVLAILLAFPRLSEAPLTDRLAAAVAGQPPVTAKIGRARTQDKAEFWTSIGGRYHVSIEYVVTVPCVPGVTVTRGPEVRTHTVRVGDEDRRGRIAVRHRVGGVVRGEDGQPVADAWVVVPAVGLFARSDAEGRFAFEPMVEGRHVIECRIPGRPAVSAELAVPGGVDFVVPGA